MNELDQGPEGLGIGRQDFAARMFDKPLGAWSTLGTSIADTFLTGTPMAGTMVRDTVTPGLARQVVGGSRGGVRWRDETAAEVAGRGDSLYSTEAEYKASPYYRPDIPFEGGLTESRAKALAEQYDLSQVRQFYASKRPYLSFLGGVIGSIPEPTNFIPVVGPLTKGKFAATMIGRALFGSADAAVNTAIFSTVMREEKARYGDDVSWEAIAQNSAFAALAGATIGGIAGAWGKYRQARQPAPAATVAPAIQPPAAAVQPMAQPFDMDGNVAATFGPETRLTVDDTGQASTVPIAPLDGVLARADTVDNRAKASAVMNEAMFSMVNDDNVRLGQIAEARIAEMSATLADVRRELTAELRRSAPPKSRKPETLTQFIAREGGIRDDGGELAARDLDKWFGPGGRLVRKRGMTLDDARAKAVEAGYLRDTAYEDGVSTSTVGDLLSALDEDQLGRPVYSRRGEQLVIELQERENYAAAKEGLDRALRDVAAALTDPVDKPILRRAVEIAATDKVDGADALERAVMEDYYGSGPNDALTYADETPIDFDEAAFDDRFGSPTERGDPEREIQDGGSGQSEAVPEDGSGAGGSSGPEGPEDFGDVGRTTGSANFSAPPPEPLPAGLSEVVARIEANAKAGVDDVDRLIADAKAEGLDPETGTHDLADELAALQEQGVLTAEDGAALAAADETYDAVEGWEDVLNVARNCVLK